MEKLFISLLTVRVVTGISCYLTDPEHPGLKEVKCSDDEHGCMAFAVKISSNNEIIRGRTCSKAGPLDNLDGVDKFVCQQLAEQFSATHCSVVFCFSDLCNDYSDLDPKPISDYNSDSGSTSALPNSVIITHPHGALLLFIVIFCGIK